ncbi:hypothetical protein LTR17_019885 [Elasticomyces elasticus]|nr:hypothetical protein LTR17_019885 [Elasticomyces elasticus]
MDSALMTPTTRSAFLELPPELRNRVYEAALIQRSPIPTHPERDIFLQPGLCKPIWRAPALLQTCRQIRCEAFKIYYALNTFSIDCSEREDVMLPVLQWLRALDVESRRALACVRLDGWCYSIGDEQSPEGNDGYEDEYSEEIKEVIERRMATLSRAGLEVKPGTLHVECWLLWAVDWLRGGIDQASLSRIVCETTITSIPGMSSTNEPPLLKLPAKIRVRIYEAALIEHHAIETRPRTYSDKQTLTWHPHPLLQTCRLIRNEATKIYYAENAFNVGSPGVEEDFERLIDLLRTLDPGLRLALRHVRVHTWRYYGDDESVAMRGEVASDLDEIVRTDLTKMRAKLEVVGVGLTPGTLQVGKLDLTFAMEAHNESVMPSTVGGL